MFVSLSPRILIQKATKKTVSVTYKRLSALSRTMGRAVQVDLTKGIKKFKSKVDPTEVFNAWKTKDYTAIYESVPWDDMPADVEPAFDILGDTVIPKAAGMVIQSLPNQINENLRFDTSNPRIRDYVDKRVGSLVVDIKASTQESIQQAVERSFDKAMTPRQVAEMIKGSIGLYPRLSGAVENYRSALELKGMDPNRIDALTGSYYDRLLNYRAMMIARTETRGAVNRGQLSVWQQGADQGLIDRATARKIWIVDGNPCQVCAPMDGVAVALDESWSLNDGSVVEVPSDSHPNCFCGMELDFGESEDKIDENQPEQVDEEEVE